MRTEGIFQDDNVIPFHRRRPAPQTEGDRHEEPEAAATTVLNAERGIINTGTVHGGQHVTTIDLSAHPHSGADGDI
ncbi:S-type pyocin domain-containing protein [Streptomyces sp. CA-210063]|uniref:S-type pyocin domain-containing protein n=1 Tax=Streptomyces sp. CA-210063 TaxID=2801029 RepID=UPI00214C60AB|nr:S-type pyocin domain-containing protein [Streptomyces sp. CA-210063]UUU35617.1 S-type pyocin domain-containing protein [Streptomyces sp. CA-210063]